MIYNLFDTNGNQVNSIVASPAFVDAYCNEMGYTYELVPEPETPEPEPTPTTEDRVTALEAQIAQADETAIELYEAQLAQEETNAAQDEALIELYEMIGG